MEASEARLPEKIRAWRAVYEARKDAEEAAEACRKRERELQAAIMELLVLSGQRSAGLPECTVSIKTRTTVTMPDHEKACQFMFEKMKKAEAEATPLVNCLIVQKRAAQNEMLEWARGELARRNIPEDYNTLKETLNSVGFDVFTTDELHYAKRS